jgi:hypothetical protein
MLAEPAILRLVIGTAVTSRALGLQPRGVEVLERIGALGDLPQRSQSLLNMYYNEGRAPFCDCGSAGLRRPCPSRRC